MMIALYAKGLTTGDIAAYLEDVYDQTVDRATISRITEVVTAEMETWQSRRLDAPGAARWVGHGRCDATRYTTQTDDQ